MSEEISVRHITRWLFAAALVLVLVCLNATPCPAAEPSGTAETDSIVSGGRTRTFRLYVPPPAVRARPMALLFVLHGGGGTGRGMVRLTYGRFERLADSRGIVVVYPDGIEKGWNDGRVGLDQPASRQKVDDVGFLGELLEHLAGRLPIDRKRVYSCGISNGGFMSFRLACDRTDLFAAVASVVAGVGETLASTRKPSRPIPVLMILGTDDPLVPFAGGQVGFPRKPRGLVLSAARSVRYWLEQNRCSSTPVRRVLPDLAFDDGTRAVSASYSGPTTASEVELITVRGGGHTWPGGLQYLPEFLIGKTSRDFDACDVIWSFFERHSLP